MSDASPRYERVVLEFELEVTDPVAVAARSLGVMQNGAGELGVYEYGDPRWVLATAVMDAAMSGGLSSATVESHGWRVFSGGVLPRYLNSDGWWNEMVLPEMPGRAPSGELIEPPGWMGKS